MRTLGYKELEALRLEALERSDLQALREIEAEARVRDRSDDTDASFNYLAISCSEDIDNLLRRTG